MLTWSTAIRQHLSLRGEGDGKGQVGIPLGGLEYNDEAAWGAIIKELDDSDVKTIIDFIDNLPPEGEGFPFEQIRKIARNTFRLIVVKMPVTPAQPDQTKKKAGKVIEVKKGSPATDERKQFLEWLAKEVRLKGTEEALRILTVSNIVVQDTWSQKALRLWASGMNQFRNLKDWLTPERIQENAKKFGAYLNEMVPTAEKIDDLGVRACYAIDDVRLSDKEVHVGGKSINLFRPIILICAGIIGVGFVIALVIGAI